MTPPAKSAPHVVGDPPVAFSSVGPAAREGPSWSRPDSLYALALVVAVFLAYQPVWQAGFIWDDDAHVTANPCIIGPLGLKEIWTSPAANYFPLVLTNFWVQHALWGLRPLPYHLVNVALHAAGAVLLWRVLGRLRIPGAGLGAALWALHPVQVESVAWISELKNTQAGVFYLLAIGFFLTWAAGAETAARRRRSYALALGSAVLAILSKPSTVMLPVILGLCWWWNGGRWSWRLGGRLAPFVLLSALASGWTIWEQKYHSLALGPEWSQTWAERLVLSGKVVWFYLGKLLWPHPLIFVYPRWTIDATSLPAYLPTVAAAGVLFCLWRYQEGWRRPLFFACAVFGVSLFPVLGFFDVYFFRYSFVSDHFQHLASLGPLALAGAGFAVVAGRGAHLRWLPATGAAAGGLLLLGLGVQTWRQSRTYADDVTLWRTTMARNPQCWLAYNVLGMDRLAQGRFREAREILEQAFRLKPDDPAVLTNLGNALLKSDRPAEAIPYFERAVRVKPGFAEAHNGLGYALSLADRLDEAIAQYEAALRSQPAFWPGHYNLARALFQRGRIAEAIEHYEAALRAKPAGSDPRDWEFHYNLANALFLRDRIAEAIEHYEAALRARPDDPDAHHNLGIALLRSGRSAEAIGQFEAAVRGRPDSADLHFLLANTLTQAGRVGEALGHYSEAARLSPESVDAHRVLGRALLQTGQIAQSVAEFETVLRLKPDLVEARADLAGALYVAGRAAEAIMHYETVLRARPDDPMAHNNLAGALSQTGRTTNAIAHYEQALRLNPDYASAHCNLALVLSGLDRKADAIRHFKEALRLKPDDAAARRNLAQLEEQPANAGTKK